MTSPHRRIVALALAVPLSLGIAACDSLPDIVPSDLPDISLPALPSDPPEPQVTETVTDAPEPEQTEPEQTATEAPPVEEPEEQPTEEETGADDEGTFPWWPVAAAAALLLALGILWGRWLARRRSWDARLRTVRAEIAWLEESLLPQLLSKSSATEALALWQAARPRVLEADRELHELAETGPSEERTALATRGREVLGALASATDADTATHEGTTAEMLRARRAELDQARTQARAWLEAAAR